MGRDTLLKATGLGRQQIQDAWDKAKANGEKLKACQRHRFDIQLDDRQFGSKWRCTACGGTVDAIARNWYQLGLVHGGV